MKNYDVILASGAEHLKESFQEEGYRVFTSALNYDRRRLFPNADIYAKLEDVSELSNRRVLIIQSCTGSGPAESEQYTTSDRVVELLLLLDLLSRPENVRETGHIYQQTNCLETPVIILGLVIIENELRDESMHRAK